MIEIVKMFAEWAFKFAGSVGRDRKAARFNDLGVNLLMIAYQITEIATCGRELLALIGSNFDTINQNSLSPASKAHLYALLRQQATRIQIVGRAIKGLRPELFAIVPEAHAEYGRLLWVEGSKGYFLTELTRRFAQGYWQAESTSGASVVFADMRKPRSDIGQHDASLLVCWEELPRQWEMLDELDELGIQLRKRVVDTFDLQSLLLEIGKRRASKTSFYMFPADLGVLPQDADLWRYLK